MSNATCNVSSYVWTRNEPASKSAGERYSEQAHERSAFYFLQNFLKI